MGIKQKRELTLADWANPDSKVVTGELVGSVVASAWAKLIGLIEDGVSVPEAQRASGVSSFQMKGALRTDPKAKEQYEAAKLASVWRNWDFETIEEVLEALMVNENGGHLNRILSSRGLDQTSFYKLMIRDPTVKEAYDEARQIQAEVSGDDLQAIADDGMNDTYTDDRGRTRVDQDVFQRSRLRVDTMKWRMSKLHWKRFGDKIQQDVTAHVTVDHASRLEQGRKRLEKLHAQRGGSKA